MRNGVTAQDVLGDDDSIFDFKESIGRDRAAQRLGILDAAGRLLAREGPEGLSMRKVAGAVNASTKVLYTMFGGKDGLIDELYVEGFARLREANAAAPTTRDPIDRLHVRSEVYLDNAIANPHYYRVMFGDPMPGFRPSKDTLARTRETFDGLVEIIREAADAGLVVLDVADHPREAAVRLWAAWHGVTSLLLAGRLIDETQARRIHRANTHSLIDSMLLAGRPDHPAGAAGHRRPRREGRSKA